MKFMRISGIFSGDSLREFLANFVVLNSQRESATIDNIVRNLNDGEYMVNMEQSDRSLDEKSMPPTDENSWIIKSPHLFLRIKPTMSTVR